MTSTLTPAVRDALDRVARTKAPTKRRMLIGDLITSFSRQADAEEFVRQLRIRDGVQDISLIPESTWTVACLEPMRNVADATYSRGALYNTLLDSEDVVIDWPSVTFHWGVAVTFTWGGVRYVARSADWQLTETYLCS